MRRKTYIYSSKKREDFLTIVNNQKEIEPGYKYQHNSHFFKVLSFIVYYGVAIPILWLISKVNNRTTIVSKKKVRKQLKDTGFIIYSNHTLMSDGFIPAVFTCYPRRTYIISLGETLMVNRPLRFILQLLGAVPLPSDLHSGKNFLVFLKQCLNKKSAVAIYPEATIWPYYTGQRPIREGSFKYPRMFDKPAIFACTTFRKPSGIFKKFLHPKVIIYLSDPVYPNRTSTEKEDEKRLETLYVQFIEKMTSLPENYAANNYVIDKHELDSFEKQGK